MTANNQIKSIFEPSINTYGEVIKDCWVNEDGYKVAQCRIENKIIFQITAPKDSHPFAYTPQRKEVRKIILVDMGVRFGQ